MITPRTLVLGLLLLAVPAAHAQLTIARAVVGAGGAAASGGAFALRGTAGQAAAGPAAGGPYVLIGGFWGGASGAPSNLATLDVRLWLQGPFNGTAMNVALTTALPPSDPYGQGTSVPDGFFGTAAGQQIVDWVLVELRAGDPAVPPMTVQRRTAALLRNDGQVVGRDGSALVVSGLPPGAYHVAVRHRNHLAAMTNAAVNATSGTVAWDFRGGLSYGTSSQASLANGQFGLYAGDGNASGSVSAADLNGVWRAQNGTAGYLAGDYNLSGSVSATDRNGYWRLNNGRATQVPAASN